jgi:hypothetical protein
MKEGLFRSNLEGVQLSSSSVEGIDAIAGSELIDAPIECADISLVDRKHVDAIHQDTLEEDVGMLRCQYSRLHDRP